jgi:hypothetical protein
LERGKIQHSELDEVVLGIKDILIKNGFIEPGVGGMYNPANCFYYSEDALTKYKSVAEFTSKWGYK